MAAEEAVRRRSARYSSASDVRSKVGKGEVPDDTVSASEPVVNLGIRLKRLREKSGMSVRGLARQLGVSPSFVSQIENGKSQPSVATLYSLSQQLGASIDELFATNIDEAEAPKIAVGEHEAVLPGVPVAPVSHAAPVSRSGLGSPADAWPREQVLARLSITTPGTRHSLEMDSGVIWNQLANNTGPGLDFIEIIYPPHSSSTNDQRMLQHVGFEFGYVVEGELEITVGFEVFTLHAGEAVGFDSAQPHLLANRTDHPARGIWCVRHGYV
jgi:transcriptional regulator with XRE-family HTH domain